MTDFKLYDYRNPISEIPDFEENSPECQYFYFTKKLWRNTPTAEWDVLFDGKEFIVEFDKNDENRKFIARENAKGTHFDGIPIVMRWNKK